MTGVDRTRPATGHPRPRPACSKPGAAAPIAGRLRPSSAWPRSPPRAARAEAAGKSPRTVRSYLDSIRVLHAFLAARGMPTDVEETDAEHLRAFILSEEQRTSAVSAAVHFRNLRVYFG